MDFSAPVGTDIFATGNGTVTFAGWRQGYGETVEIDHGFGYSTRYAHCHKLFVRPGRKVKRGDVIALVGNTGKSTGPHVHYEVHYNGRPIDPRNFYFYDRGLRQDGAVILEYGKYDGLKNIASHPRRDMCSNSFSFSICIRLPSTTTNPSWANWLSVRIALLVFMLLMFAKSSRGRSIAKVLPSSSNP